MVRDWSRTRVTMTRAWEAKHASSSLFGSEGMGAQRAAWVEAFRAEAAVLQKEEQAQTLLDMTEVFETVEYHKLVEAAKRRG